MSNKIRFIKGDNGYFPGDEIEPDMRGVAELYVDRGVAEWVKDEGFPPPNKMVKQDKVKTKA